MLLSATIFFASEILFFSGFTRKKNNLEWNFSSPLHFEKKTSLFILFHVRAFWPRHTLIQLPIEQFFQLWVISIVFTVITITI